MKREALETGQVGMRTQKQQANYADRQWFAAELDDGSGRVGAARHTEQESRDDGDRRSDVSGERAVDPYIHQRIAIWYERADANDGAGCAAERRRGNDERQSCVDAVRTAGDVVAELVNQKNRKKRERKSEACREEIVMAPEPRPGPEIVLAHHRRQPA